MRRELPVSASDFWKRLHRRCPCRRRCGCCVRVTAAAAGERRSRYIVGLKDIEALEFLVEYGEGLELLGLDQLALEPIFNLILTLVLEVFM
jgi:hypothetical protein